MKYVATCTALYDYQAQNDEEISFYADDILYILDKEDPDWHKAQLKVPTQVDGSGPIGLIPANYVDKTKPIGTVKAIYDYVSQSAEELSFNEDEVLTLYEKDDPDWFVVEKSSGEIGLAPSNYIEEQQGQSITPAFSAVNTTRVMNNSNKDEYHVDKKKATKANTTPPQPNCESKWAIALFPFRPEGPEETSLEDNEQVLITDYVTSTEWWTIEHKDGTAGIVPANYVKFQDEYEADLRAEEEEEKKRKATAEAEAAMKEKQRQEMAAREQKRREEYELRDKERQKELAERNRLREQENKEKARQLEVERRRKMQEEAKQKEIEAKRQASFAAAAIVSPQLGGGSPRRSQIPAPPPPTKPSFDNSSSNQHASASAHNDPNKPDPSKIRMWTDRTGAFKVEAQFLSCANGKIRLFKTNGVKIDVPTQKMCVEDLHYIEQETDMKLLEDKSDNIPLGQLSSTRFTWLDYFKRANLPHNACVQYAKSCENSGLGEKDVERLTHRQMKSMGMTERHVQRIQRFIETNRAEPASDDESSRPKIKGKKTVTFGAVSYIEEDDYDDYEEDSVQWQIEQDERLARQLQEQEQSNAPISGSIGLHRRGTGRPTPSHSAPKGVNSAVLTPQQFHSEPLKPTPASTLQPTQPHQTPLQPSPVSKTINAVPTPPKPAFEDDAWLPRAGTSPSVQPASTTIPPSWNHQQVHNRSIPSMNNSTMIPSAPPATSTPPPMPPRQRPTPQLSQQNLVDPQLLAKWGGSPALATANSRPVPPPPTNNNNNFVPPPQLQNQSSMNPLPVQQQPMFYQQQSQLSTGNSSFTSLQQQLPTGNSSISSLQQVTGNSSFTSLPTSNGSFTSLQQQSTGLTPLQQQQQVYNNSPSMQPANQQFMGSTASIHTQSSLVPVQSVLPPVIVPQTQSFQPQMTGSAAGRNWASATPDNPFGGASPSPAPMHNTVGSFQQPQQFNSLPLQNTGYVPQPYNTIIDPNDKYSVFKTVDTSAPSVFNSNNINNNNQQQQQRNFYY